MGDHTESECFRNNWHRELVISRMTTSSDSTNLCYLLRSIWIELTPRRMYRLTPLTKQFVMMLEHVTRQCWVKGQDILVLDVTVSLVNHIYDSF